MMNCQVLYVALWSLSSHCVPLFFSPGLGCADQQQLNLSFRVCFEFETVLADDLVILQQVCFQYQPTLKVMLEIRYLRKRFYLSISTTAYSQLIYWLKTIYTITVNFQLLLTRQIGKVKSQVYMANAQPNCNVNKSRRNQACVTVPLV